MNAQHVFAAKWVATRVSEMMPYGPENAPGGWRNQRIIQEGAEERVAESRESLGKWMFSEGITDKKTFAAKREQYLSKQADLGLTHRAGNCDAMGALAYRLLKQSPALRPLAIHSFQKPDRSDAHVFVSINQTTADAPFADWDANAVVICDPWLAHMHVLLAHMFSHPCTPDELMGAYTVPRHGQFMNDLGYAGGSEVELSRTS